jgi:hypothetical protein
MSAQPLGKKQKSILESLKGHKLYYPGCGWYWDTPSGTVKLLESLVKRGLARKVREKRSVYSSRALDIDVYYPVEDECQPK